MFDPRVVLQFRKLLHANIALAKSAKDERRLAQEVQQLLSQNPSEKILSGLTLGVSDVAGRPPDEVAAIRSFLLWCALQSIREFAFTFTSALETNRSKGAPLSFRPQLLVELQAHGPDKHEFHEIIADAGIEAGGCYIVCPDGYVQLLRLINPTEEEEDDAADAAADDRGAPQEMSTSPDAPKYLVSKTPIKMGTKVVKGLSPDQTTRDVEVATELYNQVATLGVMNDDTADVRANKDARWGQKLAFARPWAPVPVLSPPVHRNHQLDDYQHSALQKLKHNVDGIEAPPGSGKTHIANAIAQWVPPVTGARLPIVLFTSTMNAAIEAVLKTTLKQISTSKVTPLTRVLTYGNSQRVMPEARKFLPVNHMRRLRDQLTAFMGISETCMKEKDIAWRNATKLMPGDTPSLGGMSEMRRETESVLKQAPSTIDRVFGTVDSIHRLTKMFAGGDDQGGTEEGKKKRAKYQLPTPPNPYAPKVDAVILDEGGTVPLYKIVHVLALNPTRIIVTGDTRQLPPYTADGEASVGPVSVLGHITTHRPAALVPFLAVQRRFGKATGDMVGKAFYEGRLHSDPKVCEERAREAAMLGVPELSWIDVGHTHGDECCPEGSKSKWRPVEVMVVVQRVLQLLYKEAEVARLDPSRPPVKILVVAPYRPQCDVLRVALADVLGTVYVEGTDDDPAGGSPPAPEMVAWGKQSDNQAPTVEPLPPFDTTVPPSEAPPSWVPKGATVTVRSFTTAQGSEYTHTVASMTRCNNRGNIGFLSEHQKMGAGNLCVALTRHQTSLTLIGCRGTFTAKGSSTWGIVSDHTENVTEFTVDEHSGWMDRCNAWTEGTAHGKVRAHRGATAKAQGYGDIGAHSGRNGARAEADFRARNASS